MSPVSQATIQSYDCGCKTQRIVKTKKRKTNRSTAWELEPAVVARSGTQTQALPDSCVSLYPALRVSVRHFQISASPPWAEDAIESWDVNVLLLSWVVYVPFSAPRLKGINNRQLVGRINAQCGHGQSGTFFSPHHANATVEKSPML